MCKPVSKENIMQINRGSKEKIIIEKFDYEYVKVNDELFAYKISVKILDENRQLMHMANHQGIADKNVMNAIMQGQVPSQEAVKRYYVMTEEEIDAIQQRGSRAFSDSKFTGFRNTDVFDWIANGGSIAQVLYFNHNNHSFWHLDETIMPSAIAFDYIDAHFHNGLYDLERALEYLKARKDVYFEPGRDKISHIPHYNVTGQIRTFLFFMWTPNKEQAARILEKGLDRHALIFEEDMLGLRVAGIAKSDDFYEDENFGKNEDE